MANIHATAVVDPSAKLGTGVEIGPFCVIGPDVELGEGTKVHSHAAIGGRTRRTLITANRNGLGPRSRGVAREDLATEENEVGRLLRCHGAGVERRAEQRDPQSTSGNA